VPKSYAPFSQVIGRQLDTHSIAGKYANAMLPHLAAHVRHDCVAITQSDHEPGVGQDLADNTLHFDHFLFGHDISAL